MRKKRTFKPQLKAQAVLQLLSGSKSAAQMGYMTPAEFEAQWKMKQSASIL